LDVFDNIDFVLTVAKLPKDEIEHAKKIGLGEDCYELVNIG